MINRVSDRTKLDWEAVWNLDIYTFLNYLRFDVNFRKMEEQEIKRWRETH